MATTSDVLAAGLGAAIGDPDGTRTVTAVIALLVVLGIGLVMLAVWLFKVTRPDRELLAPLDVMGDRKWRRADPVWQRRRLDQVRPPDAKPIQPSAAPPELDEAFDQGPSASGFDDLHDDHHPPPLEIDEPLAPEGEVADQAGSDDITTPAGPHNSTPTGIPRPDELPEGEIDPAVLEQAMRELEEELRNRRQLVDGDDNH